LYPFQNLPFSIPRRSFLPIFNPSSTLLLSSCSSIEIQRRRFTNSQLFYLAGPLSLSEALSPGLVSLSVARGRRGIFSLSRKAFENSLGWTPHPRFEDFPRFCYSSKVVAFWPPCMSSFRSKREFLGSRSGLSRFFLIAVFLLLCSQIWRTKVVFPASLHPLDKMFAMFPSSRLFSV